MSSRHKAIAQARKLNKHYGLKVKFRTGEHHSGPYPYADLRQAAIVIPNKELFHTPHVIAHEFAHILDSKNGIKMLHRQHDKGFEAVYKECCLVLGISYIPTQELRKMVRAKLKKGDSPSA